MPDPAAFDLSRNLLEAVVQGRYGDPFAILAPREVEGRLRVRALLPGARTVRAVGSNGKSLADLQQVHPDGLFEGFLPPSVAYRYHIVWPTGEEEVEDPYAFGPLLGELDLHLLAEGRHRELGRCLGAQVLSVQGVPGVRFAVWAPNARRVAVVGEFNRWDGRRHPMRLRHEAGVWELFLPRVAPGALYKYEITGANGDRLPLKADPVARETEHPPATASRVAAPTAFRWHDDAWMKSRARRQTSQAPVSIYEVHPGSWLRIMEEGGRSLNWAELSERLVPYVRDMGFTHLELLPVMEHPFGGSWGYQPLSLFAPSARFGRPADFAQFVDCCHQAGVGVILDWVPGHFPSDPHGLVRFDGTALYEHEDPREGHHRDWDTLIYNFGRNEVRGFLIGSALEWLERYHCDGLRVDAVASMLYRDYSRAPGQWIPNVLGGRENLEAIDFLRELNSIVAERCPGTLMIAEESTAWPGVTAPVADGGLGFGFKWNMGWMHDSLRYMALDPLHRRHHHEALTFGLIYAFSERFVLPLSHDEVVHGKGSLYQRMPGDRWQKLAQLRAYFGFMWAHPGKKLLFMGGELGQPQEWNHDASAHWDLLDDPAHRGLQRLVRDLNRAYATEPALHFHDAAPAGFQWLVGDDRENSVFAFMRKGEQGQAPVVAVCNFTPLARQGYRLGLPATGRWRELINTDAEVYGGSGRGHGGIVTAHAEPAHGQPASAMLNLPPLATVFLRPES